MVSRIPGPGGGRSPERPFSGGNPAYNNGGGYGASRLPMSPRASGVKPANSFGPTKKAEGGSTLKKQMSRAAGLEMDDVDTADIDKLRAAAAAAVKMEARLNEVEVERARELRELQVMMSSLQRKEEELSKFVSSVQKRRQETDPYEKAQLRIQELEKELAHALDESNMDAEHRRLREESVKLGGLFQRVEAAVQRVLNTNKASFLGTDEERTLLEQSEEARRMEKEEITQLTEEMLAETEGLKAQLNSETTKRKKLHNQLVNLRGAIRVFCRVRPMLDAAGEHIEGTVSTEVDDTTDSISVVGNRANAYKPQEIKQKKFSFDRVFAMDSSQEAIYDETSAVVTSVMDGYNVCIFAYGQTGSGKTFTMEGSEDSRGVNYRTLGELFELAKFRRSQMQYSFNVSLVEVYNEEVRDLLADHTTEVTWNSHNKAPAQSRPHLELRVQPDGRVDVPGLISREVSNLGAAWEVLQRASSVRSSGETKSNAHSSRSHCLLRVAVHGYNKLNKDEMNAKLWLVDLAGSERVGKSEATGARLKEAQFINRSLSSLGDCIYALATKSAHIPYRNSKLTHLLADSLGGDSKTVMIVNVSPNVSDIGETTCSLNFASRVRGVEMGPAKRHVESNMSEVQKAKMQVTDLKAQVEELQEGKAAQQKKLREAAAEQASMANQLKKKERAAARLERKVSRLQEKLGAVDEEEEVEEEEDDDESINVGTLEQFLAPTASPVYKAAGSTAAAPLGGATGTTPEPHQQQSSSTPASTMHPSSLKMAQLAGQLGESLVIRASEADFEAGKPSPQEVVEIVVTQPKSETFVARFADYRQRPDRQEVDPLVAAAEAAEAEKMRKKKNGFGRKVKRWVGFW